ncbi:MAG: hypothetical protein H6611_00030, partial [Ignavibacteriales bacterium]|nr:hypothetical protein [Ignavibacteriales bacterium]
MKIVYFFCFLVIGFNVLLCQDVDPKRPFRPVTFLDFKPFWYSTIQDSHFIDKSVRRNQINCFELNDRTPDISSENNLFSCLYIQRENDFEGSYILNIDLKSGEIKWRNYFNLSTQSKQEFSRSMSITDSNLEILGMKTQTLFGSSALPISVFDTMCWMTKRIYDKNTGQLIKNFQSDPNDLKSQKMALGNRKTIKYSQIFKIGESKYKYVHHNKIRPNNTIDFCDLDNLGNRLDSLKSLQLNRRLDQFNFFQLENNQFLMIEDDFKNENNRYSFYFLKDLLDTLKVVQTNEVIPKDAFIKEINHELYYTIFQTTTYDDLDSFKLFPNIIFWVIDFDGQVLKKVHLEDTNGNYMNHFVYNYNRIDNELIVAYALGQSLFEPPKSKLQ